MVQEIPIEIIERLSKQGLTEMEIISQLKLRGFHEDQITRAIQQAIKSGVVGKPGVPARPYVHGGESDIKIPRHPIKPLEKPEPTLPPKKESPPLSKPPEQISLPENLKPMEISKPDTVNEVKPSFVENAPVKPPEPKPLAPAPVAPLPKPPAPHPTRTLPPKPKPLPLKPKHEDITLEELVEEVVHAEVEKTNKKISVLLNKNTKLHEEIADLKKKTLKIVKLLGNKISETDVKVGETSSRIVAIENRISALEEAFKSLGAAINKTKPRRTSHKKSNHRKHKKTR